MAYQIHVFHIEKLLVVDFYGEISLDEVMKYQNEIITYPEFNHHYDMLKDYRNAIRTFSYNNQVKKIHTDGQTNSNPKRLCHIESTPIGTAMTMLFNHSIKGSLIFDVFSTVDGAATFLRIPNLDKLLNVVSLKRQC